MKRSIIGLMVVAGLLTMFAPAVLAQETTQKLELTCCTLGKNETEVPWSQQAPIRGQKIVVRLTGVEDPSQWQLTMTYRPNSATEKTTPPTSFGADGLLRLTPQSSGIVALTAKGPGEKDKISFNIAVRFPSPPISGIIILLFAGTILFGGAGYSLLRAIKE